MEKHAKYKHPYQLDLGGPTPHFVDQHKSATIAAFDKGSVDLCVQENRQQENNLPTHQQSERLENRRGRSKRKSNTMQFKKQTVDLLDSLANSRNKLYFLFGVATFFQWKKVTDAREVSRSLVVKWNKARQSSLSEIARKKQKSKAGSVREARRRRQMVGDKTRNSEKQPVAAKLVVAEFNLR